MPKWMVCCVNNCMKGACDQCAILLLLLLLLLLLGVGAHVCISGRNGLSEHYVPECECVCTCVRVRALQDVLSII